MACHAAAPSAAKSGDSHWAPRLDPQPAKAWAPDKQACLGIERTNPNECRPAIGEVSEERHRQGQSGHCEIPIASTGTDGVDVRGRSDEQTAAGSRH